MSDRAVNLENDRFRYVCPTAPCSRHRARHPVGVTCTAIRNPHSMQKCGGSSARAQPGHAVDGRPHDGQNRSPTTAQITFERTPIGMRRSSSIWRSSSGVRPRVVR